jgi:hypothetical protein
METKFIDVVANWAKTAPLSEIIQLRNSLEKTLDLDNLDNNLLAIQSRDGIIFAIKYLRELKGWGLKECKEYIDKLN